MAFTNNCDLYGAVHEDGINRVAQHIMQQRPSMFNYGTSRVARYPKLLCKQIFPAPAVRERGNPLLTVENPLTVLGTGGTVALDFCVQFTEVKIDLHPGDCFDLPAGLRSPLEPQHFAIRVKTCAGLGCLGGKEVDNIPIPVPGVDPEKEMQTGTPFILDTDKLKCFCLDLYAVGHFELGGAVGSQKLSGKVDDLEIVDIRPAGLENNLECYLSLLLKLVVLPRASVSLEKMIFEILDLATVTLSPSAGVPNNPAIEENQLKVFIDAEVSP